MLSIVPSFKLAEQKTELIFVVDRSGSMQGSGIEQAKQALKVSISAESSSDACYGMVFLFSLFLALDFPPFPAS